MQTFCSFGHQQRVTLTAVPAALLLAAAFATGIGIGHQRPDNSASSTDIVLTSSTTKPLTSNITTAAHLVPATTNGQQKSYDYGVKVGKELRKAGLGLASFLKGVYAALANKS